MRSLRLRSAGALLAASTLLAAGCGREGVDLSAAAAAALDGQVVQIRRAVAAGQRVTAQAQVAELRGMADRLHEQGDIGDARAERIRAAAAEVEAQLSLLPSPRPRNEPADEKSDEKSDEKDSDDRDNEESDSDARDPGDAVDSEADQRVAEARRRVEEQLREAEKKIEEANRKADKAGKGEGN